MRKLRAGIVGCSGIANDKHLPAIQRNGNFEITAFCDLFEERAQTAKETYGTPDARVYTDYRELLKEGPWTLFMCLRRTARMRR